MNNTTLIKDANGSIIPQQYYDEESQKFQVLANGDTSDVDFSEKVLLKDANLRIIPSQYYDVDRGEFVVGVLPGGGTGGGGEIGTVTWSSVQNKPQTFPPSEHTHDDRYNTKSELQDAIDYVRQSMTRSQGLVAIHSDDKPDYLANKVDNVTLTVEGSEVKVKSVDGLSIGTAQLNTWLSGTEANLQNQINDLNGLLATVTAGMSYLGKFETKAELNGVNNKDNGDLAVVLTDETRSNARTMYVYNESLGLWDFLGAFEFSDEFLALKDTPNSYTGADGKVLKVDETNKKIVFSDIDYGEIRNKPDRTKTQIENAVDKAHEHPNVTNLNKISENGGVLTYNGVKYVRESDLEGYINESDLTDYVPKSTLNDYIKKTDINIYIPKKKFLLATNNSTNLTVIKGNFIKFPNKRGTIPYDSNTGLFELEIGKDYEIQLMLLAEFNDYIKFYISKPDKSLHYLPKGTLYSHQQTKNRGSSGNFHTIFTATQSTGNSLGIIIGTDSSSQDSSVKLIYEECALIIKEL